MDVSAADLGTAFDLLRKNSTLHLVSQYMERREIVPASANSWPQWYEARLLPALRSGRMSRKDIVRLLRDSEEHGRQHIFLFKCSKATAAALVNTDTIRHSAKRMGLEDLLDKPRIVDEPKGLELVDIRIDAPKKGDRSLVIKAVDIREYRNQISVEKQGNREIVTYEFERDRAVNLISVREDGLAEVRIESYRNTLDYERAAKNLFSKAAGLVDELSFSPVSLTKARIRFVKERKQLAHLIRFADNQLRDREGRTYSMATGSRQQELYPEGSATDKSLEAFLSVGVPACDEVNCFWVLRKGSPVPSTEAHTLIMGADNEFTLTGKCDRADYEYVLSNILNLSR